MVVTDHTVLNHLIFDCP